MLGPRDPAVPAEVALGTMNFGDRTDAAESERIVARALERGVRWFDTANAYTDGEAERILGRALRDHGGSARVATKVGLGRIDGKREGLSRAAVLRAVDGSLERLGLDAVDVLYLHRPDRRTPIEQTLGALAELLEAGKIRAFGVSNYAAWQIVEICGRCDVLGLPRPAISQVLYNLLIRQVEIEYRSFAASYRIHTTVYNPLAGGLLVGEYRREAGIRPGSRFEDNELYQRRYWSGRFFDLVEEYRGVAREAGLSLLELSYAWLARRPGVDSILAGPATVAHLDAALDACARVLPDEVVARVDEIYRAFQGTDATYAR